MGVVILKAGHEEYLDAIRFHADIGLSGTSGLATVMAVGKSTSLRIHPGKVHQGNLRMISPTVVLYLSSVM